MGSRTHARNVAVLRASRTSMVLFTGALLVSRSPQCRAHPRVSASRSISVRHRTLFGKADQTTGDVGES